MRALYYDVIDPTHVEKYIKAIYQDPGKLEERPEDASGDELPLELEDIQFLIKNARGCCRRRQRDHRPRRPGRGLATAAGAAGRARKVRPAVCGALKTLYADTEPPLALNRPGQAANFSSATASQRKRSSRNLKKLAADASALFPTDFPDAKPAGEEETAEQNGRRRRGRRGTWLGSAPTRVTPPTSSGRIPVICA